MEVYTRVQLEKMKMKDLVEVYNKLVLAGHAPGKQVKSLKTKPAGVTRILNIQANILEDIGSKMPTMATADNVVFMKKVVSKKIPLHVRQLLDAHKELSNEDFSHLPAFDKMCAQANTPVTTRQASKFRNFRGLAFNLAIID